LLAVALFGCAAETPAPQPPVIVRVPVPVLVPAKPAPVPKAQFRKRLNAVKGKVDELKAKLDERERAAGE
jgi:hypothetical protein